MPLNLAISLVTLAVALATRGRTLSFASLMPFLPAVCALIAGAVLTALIGPALASRLSEERLERIILVLLVLIGLALIIKGSFPKRFQDFSQPCSPGTSVSVSSLAWPLDLSVDFLTWRAVN